MALVSEPASLEMKSPDDEDCVRTSAVKRLGDSEPQYLTKGSLPRRLAS